jgi:outer membrane receptor protein involved in Fe transport
MRKVGMLFYLAGILLISTNLYGQTLTDGSIVGKLIAKSTKNPLEFSNVTLYKLPDSAFVRGTMTDTEGKFYLNSILDGEYYLVCGRIGFEQVNSASFIIDPKHPQKNIGKISIAETSLPANDLVVTADRPTTTFAIDRLVYDTQKDLIVESGSAADLLQHVPSVTVDLEGNVTLKGSEDVLILIDGRSSPLMGKNRAAVLQAMPANSIERVEVINNPSAKYNPEGTAGIINLVLKKNTDVGVNGSVSTNGGWDSRFNGNIVINYNPGHFNFFGNYGMRKDYGARSSLDARRLLDQGSQTNSYYNHNGSDNFRPLSNMAGLGMDYTPNQHNRLGISGNYFFRDNTLRSNSRNTLLDNNSAITNDYVRSLQQSVRDFENAGTAYYEHSFANTDHTVHIEYNISGQPNKEDSRYTNTYYVVAQNPQYDNTLFKQSDLQHQFSIGYSNPISEKSKLEAGFSYEQNKQDIDNRAEYFDTTAQSFVTDIGKTNHFVFREKIGAVYMTFMHSFGKFGAMAGLRYEYAQNNSHLITRDSTIKNEYSEFYPSLHMSYSLSGNSMLQLSYSRRTNRPDGENLNPFPVYRDPLNVDAGNPRLLPEFTHSVLLGWQLSKAQVTITPAIFYMNEYNRFTPITEPFQDSVLVTTTRNLSSAQSGGAQLIIGGSIGNNIDIDFNVSAFHTTIDASNIGFGDNKSANSWTGYLDVNWKIKRSTLVQSSTNWWSSRLTPQGKYLGAYLSNLGMRQNFYNDKVSITLTVTDVFKSRTFRSHLNTAWLTSDSKMSRNSQVIFLGATYRFGNAFKRYVRNTLDYEK